MLRESFEKNKANDDVGVARYDYEQHEISEFEEDDEYHDLEDAKIEKVLKKLGEWYIVPPPQGAYFSS